MRIVADNLQDTFKFAQDFAKSLIGNEIIVLEGIVGAGKTTFTKALIKNLGIDELVTSPTFAFLKVYENGSIKINHYDLYRSDDAEELFELGLFEGLQENAISIIEWNKFFNFPENKRIITIFIKELDCGRREFIVEQK